MLNLLIKDFRLMFSLDRGGKKGILKALLSILFSLSFVAIEVFLFSAILNKIQHFHDAPVTFMLLFLLILSAFMTVSGVLQAKKLFFNEQDIRQLANHPVENGKMILSKLIFLIGIHYVTALLFEYPLFVAYGMLLGKTAWYYYTALFYPLLASVFELGIALLLVYPVWMFLQYLKKHVWLEFLLSITLIFSLLWPYSKVLSLFVDLVSNQSLNVLFTEESMEAVAKFGEYAIPLNFLVDVFIGKRSAGMFPYLAIAGGIFFLGMSITVFTFHRVRNMAVAAKSKKAIFVYKPRSVLYGLVRKELILLTKNPDYVFSFSGLLLAQPFLLFTVVTAMNSIFSSGTLLYYTTLFPNFVALIDVFLVIMVTLIINSGANQYISMEQRTIKNLKTIPVASKKQLWIKLLIPYCLSSFFLFVSLLVLLLSKTVSLITATASLLLALLVLFVFDVVSMREELQIRHGKPRSTYLSSVVSYVLPFAYIALVMLLSYNKFPLWAIYLLGGALFTLLGLPFLQNVRKNMADWFMELEAIN